MSGGGGRAVLKMTAICLCDSIVELPSEASEAARQLDDDL